MLVIILLGACASQGPVVRHQGDVTSIEKVVILPAAIDSQVPEVASLTMVTTPNHGSQMARFRLVVEVRNQLARLTKGGANWQQNVSVDRQKQVDAIGSYMISMTHG